MVGQTVEEYNYYGISSSGSTILNPVEKNWFLSKVTDDFGRPAKTWYNKADKIGTYAKEADVVYTTKTKAETIYKDLDLSKAYNYATVVDGVKVLTLWLPRRMAPRSTALPAMPTPRSVPATVL